jgi:ABC transporter DrrB family efflux protein
MFDGLWAIAWKEFLHVIRDPATRFVLLIPVFQLVVFGYAIRLEIENIPTVIVDQDNSVESRELISAFQNTRTFEVSERAYDLNAARQLIIAGDARVGLIVPDGYARSLMRGEPAPALVLVDGSNSTEASAALNVSRALAMSSARRLSPSTWRELDLPPRLPPTIDIRVRLLFNPNLRSANFFVPGLVGIIMQLITIMLTSFSIVRERERGTFEQLLTTPIGSWGLLLGKIAPYAVIAVFETIVVLVLMVTVFGVPIAGNLFLLAGLSALFLLTSLALGVIISTFAATQMEAMQLAFLILLPSILLSGFMFPIPSIPEPIQSVTYIIPARYFIEILRGIVLRDASLADLAFESFALAGYTVVLLGIGAARFRKRLD